MLIDDPTEFPDVLYHTVTIEQDEGGFHISASTNDHLCICNVGSVGIGDGGEAIGVNDGKITFGEADRAMRLEYVDFGDEYAYDEIQITFEDRDHE